MSKKASENELIASIERLGDLFGQVQDLANNIRKQVKEKYGYHSFSVGVLSMCRGLAHAEDGYNEFHTYFLEQLLKEKEG